MPDLAYLLFGCPFSRLRRSRIIMQEGNHRAHGAQQRWFIPTQYYDVLHEAKAAEGWSLDSATLLASNSPLGFQAFDSSQFQSFSQGSRTSCAAPSPLHAVSTPCRLEPSYGWSMHGQRTYHNLPSLSARPCDIDRQVQECFAGTQSLTAA